MGSKASTIEDQIKILKDRGMEFDEPIDKVEEILLDIGYYRLGFYWNPFETGRKHNFKKGTKFSDVVKLYYFDVDLRLLLLKALNRIEINFKTKLIYYVSNNHSDSPTWFADSKVVSRSFVETLPLFYHDDFKKNNLVIQKHHTKYLNDKYAPAWKTLEFFTFGTVFKLFKSLKNQDEQDLIASKYGVKKDYIFRDHIIKLISVRNLCAHGGVLFDFSFSTGVKKIPALELTSRDTTSLEVAIKLISYYYGVISENRRDDFLKEVNNLFTKAKESKGLKAILEADY